MSKIPLITDITLLILGLLGFLILYHNIPTDCLYNGARVYYDVNYTSTRCGKGTCFKTICEAQSHHPHHPLQIIIETNPWDDKIPILTLDNILWNSTLIIFIVLITIKIFKLLYNIYYKKSNNQENYITYQY